MNTIFNRLQVQDIPILEIGNRSGYTDYIDFITTEDLGNNNIMRGRDAYNRPFLCVKVNVYEETSDTVQTESAIEGTLQKYEAVGTFFQRYTDSHSAIAFGTCYPQNLIYDDSRVRSERDQIIIANRINMLLHGETINDYDSWRYNDYESERVVGNGKKKIWMQSRRDLKTKILEEHMYPDIKKCVQDYL